MNDWRAIGDTTVAEYERRFRAVGSPLLPLARQLRDAASPHSAVALATSEWEQIHWTWTASPIPRAYHNPLSLAKPEGGAGADRWMAYPDVVACFADWRERVTSATYKGGVYARTRSLAELVAVYAPRSENDTEQLIRQAEAAIRGMPPVATEPAMTTFTDLPFRALVVGTQANAPDVALNPGDLWITAHETGNTNVGANALMHRNFVAAGGGVDRVSFTFCVDDREAIQIVRADRIGYHASDGCDNRATDLGCFASLAIETCVNADGNWARTKEHLAKLIAMIVLGDERIVGLRRGAFSFSRVATHHKWAWDGKWCPTRLLNEGALPIVVAQARAYAEEAEDQAPEYARPVTYPWLEPAEAEKGRDRAIGKTRVYYLHQIYEAVRPTPRRQATGANKKVVGPPLEQGERFAADYVYRSGDQSFVLTPWGTRIAARDLVPRVSIAKSGTIAVRRDPA